MSRKIHNNMSKPYKLSAGYSSKLLSIMLPFVVLVIGGVWWCWEKFHDPQFLPVKVVRVVSSYQKVGRVDLQRTILPYVTHGFLTVNVTALQHQLQNIPWIENASIKKVWPDTLIIGVKEQKAIARWNKNSLINEEGLVFTPQQQSLPNNLPLLHGPDDQTKLMLMSYNKMSQMVRPLNLKIAELDLSSRRAWRVVLSNGLQLFLGRNDVLERLQRIVNAYNSIFKAQQENLVYIDARYRNGLAVQWKNGGTAIETNKEN